MKTRLSNEKENKIFLDTIYPDLNKILKNQLNYDNQFTKFFQNYDRHLPNTNKFSPYLLNVSPVNYDFGFGSWLKVVFFTNRMKINVIDNSSKTVNSNLIAERLSNLDRLEGNEQFVNNNEPIHAPKKSSTFVLLNSNDYAWLKHLLAGASAGVASRTCTAPLDRIKVLLQVKKSEVESIKSCYKFIKEEGGYRAFWRGNGINCIKIAPEIALRFMFYEQFKKYIKGDSDRQLAIYERLISGSLAGSLSQSIIYPMEVIKTRLCLRKTGQYNGIVDALKKIYKIEGYRTFYRGFCVNLVGILPYSGIDLTVYETLKNFYLGNFQNEDPSVLIVLVCGITSNISGQVFSYPLALIRTRLQAINDKNVGFNTLRKQIYRNHGIFGFYSGFLANLIKVAPANAITYIVYEQIRQLLNAKMS